MRDVPDSDQAIGVSGIESGSVHGPREACREGNERLVSTSLLLFWLEFADNVLGLKVPNGDALGGGSAEPVLIWREAERVDDCALCLERVESLSFVQVPEHGRAVLTARGAERAIWGDCDSVEVTSVANKRGHSLEVREGVNLNDLVPTGRNNNGVLHVGGEAHARDPVRVGVFNGHLALADGVPKLDGAIAGARDDLSVIWRKGHREGVLLVADELLSGLASL